MSRACVFLADGFEEIEGLTVVDILRRAGVRTETVSVTDGLSVVGSHKIVVQADARIQEVDFSEVELLVLPGGMPGTIHLGECERLTKLLADFAAKERKVAAICAAPSILGDLGLLKGKKAACYPGFEGRLEGAKVVYDEVARDGCITTSRGMGTAIPFALSLVSQLVSEDKAEEIRKGIIYGPSLPRE